MLEQLKQHDLFPELPAPEFNQSGGVVAPGFELRFDAEAPVYYTLDGSDPRLIGGATNPAASTASGGISQLSLVDENTPAQIVIPADGNFGGDEQACATCMTALVEEIYD